jgi:hypothetical protein
MPTLASEVFDRSRAVLNDVAKDLYTDEVLLPYLKIANDDLSDALVDNGGTVQKEVAVSIPLAIGNPLPPVPDDMIVPIEIFEKDSGQDDSYFRFMRQRDFLPNGVPKAELGVWAWREQAIVTLGATINKVLRVRYYKLMTEIAGVNTPITLTHSLNYLAYHTGALASEHIGQNRAKAIDLEGMAIQKLNKLLKKEVKQSQSHPVRRLPFRLNRYTHFTR